MIYSTLSASQLTRTCGIRDTNSRLWYWGAKNTMYYSDNASTWLTETLPSTGPTSIGSGGQHSFCTDSSGNLHLIRIGVYQIAGINYNKLVYQKRDVTTGIWSNPEVIVDTDDSGIGYSTNLSICVDSLDNIYVVYTKGTVNWQGYYEYNIYYITYSGSWGSETQVTNYVRGVEKASHGIDQLCIMCDLNNTIHCAFRRQGYNLDLTIYAEVRYLSIGSSNILIYEGTDLSNVYYTAVDLDGNVMVLYRTTPGLDNLYYTDSVSSWSQTLLWSSATGGIGDANIQCDTNGYITVFYNYQTSGIDTFYYRRKYGSTWLDAVAFFTSASYGTLYCPPMHYSFWPIVNNARVNMPHYGFNFFLIRAQAGGNFTRYYYSEATDDSGVGGENKDFEWPTEEEGPPVSTHPIIFYSRTNSAPVIFYNRTDLPVIFYNRT